MNISPIRFGNATVTQRIQEIPNDVGNNQSGQIAYALAPLAQQAAATLANNLTNADSYQGTTTETIAAAGILNVLTQR